MGLTIHYKLKAKARTTDSVKGIVDDLYAFVKDLEEKGVIHSVEDVKYFSPEELEAYYRYGDEWRALSHAHYPLNDDGYLMTDEQKKEKVAELQRLQREAINDPDDEWSWALIQAGKYVHKRVKVAPARHGRKALYREMSVNVNPVEGFIVSVYPGHGSEQANFGFVRFPKEMTIQGSFQRVEDNVVSFDNEKQIKTGLSGWIWSSFCKTQYASNYGTANFLRCHLGVCSILEYLQNTGKVTVDVNDEGKFWEKRDIDELASEVGTWNKMIAALFGTLSNVAEGTGTSIQAPITEHPDFEVLETKGVEEMPHLMALEGIGKELANMLGIATKSYQMEKDAFIMRPVTDTDDTITWFRYMKEKLDEAEGTGNLLDQIMKEFEASYDDNYPSAIDPTRMIELIGKYQESLREAAEA